VSLIHDALKKAQKKAASEPDAKDATKEAPSRPLIEKELDISGGEEFQAPLRSKRTLVILSLFLISVGYFGYTRLSTVEKKPEETYKGAVGEAPLASSTGDAESLKAQALQAYRDQDYEVAWAKFVAASAVAGNDPVVWNNLGVVSKKQGEFQKASEAYEKALRLKPDYPEALNNLAALHLLLGNTDKAKVELDKALKLNPAYAEALFHRAMVAEEEKELGSAISYWKSFLRFGTSMPPSLLDQVRDHVLEIEP